MTADDNPLLDIRFAIPFDRIDADQVEPAIEALLDDARVRVRAIAETSGAKTYDNTLGALDRATERLEYAMGIIGHLESVATTPDLRRAYNAVQPAVSEFYSSIPLDTELWAAIRELATSEAGRRLSGVRKRHLDRTVDEFRRHGAELPDDRKTELSKLDVELARLTKKFAENVLDGTNAFELVVENAEQLAGLPATAIEAARESAIARGREGWRFTLQAPSLIPALTHLDDAGLREQLWRASNSRAASDPFDNRPLVAEILRLRRQRANLLGYRNFADLVLEDRMAHDGASARRFIDELREKTGRYFVGENDALAAFCRSHLGENEPEIAPWDVGYWAEKQRKALYDFDDEELRPYFAVDDVISGMFVIAERLYGISITKRDDLPTWDRAVRSYVLRDGDGTELGAFHVDLYPRENKRDGAWMNELITGLPGATGRLPHLGLICANVTPPVGAKPALLTHAEVETLFHEFGHLMHLMLSKVEVRSLAGSNVAWDFVELPSQIMENWCWERPALDLFARHWQTGHPIPEPLFQRMHRARTYRAANAMMRQLGFAAVDLALHVDYDPARDGDVMVYARRILERHSPVPLPDDYAMIAGFQHLFGHPVGYAAAYYSYKWAEVLDADAFQRFKERGVFDRETGLAFRREILERGNSQEPMELYRGFMGREPDIDPLLRRSGLIGSA